MTVCVTRPYAFQSNVLTCMQFILIFMCLHNVYACKWMYVCMCICVSGICAKKLVWCRYVYMFVCMYVHTCKHVYISTCIQTLHCENFGWLTNLIFLLSFITKMYHKSNSVCFTDNFGDWLEYGYKIIILPTRCVGVCVCAYVEMYMLCMHMYVCITNSVAHMFESV